MKSSFAVTAFLTLGLMVGGCGSPQSASSARDPEPDTERTLTGGEAYHGLIQYRAKDSKQAIIDPLFLDAEDAPLAAGTKVIGVFIDGQARAYPLFILSNHQIVNDQIAGTPFSASW